MKNRSLIITAVATIAFAATIIASFQDLGVAMLLILAGGGSMFMGLFLGIKQSRQLYKWRKTSPRMPIRDTKSPWLFWFFYTGGVALFLLGYGLIVVMLSPVAIAASTLINLPIVLMAVVSALWALILLRQQWGWFVLAVVLFVVGYWLIKHAIVTLLVLILLNQIINNARMTYVEFSLTRILKALEGGSKSTTTTQKQPPHMNQ